MAMRSGSQRGIVGFFKGGCGGSSGGGEKENVSVDEKAQAAVAVADVRGMKAKDTAAAGSTKKAPLEDQSEKTWKGIAVEEVKVGKVVKAKVKGK